MNSPWVENVPEPNKELELKLLFTRLIKNWTAKGADEVLYFDEDGNHEFKSFVDSVLLGAKELDENMSKEELPSMFFFGQEGYILGAIPATENDAFELKKDEWIAFFDPNNGLENGIKSIDQYKYRS